MKKLDFEFKPLTDEQMEFLSTLFLPTPAQAFDLSGEMDDVEFEDEILF